jgi:hypothetical protein
MQTNAKKQATLVIKLLAARGKQFCGTITAPKMEKQTRKYFFSGGSTGQIGPRPSHC